MKLHVDIEGSGPDLVMLHGWGLNSRIWNAVAAELAPSYRLHRIDLPGHGLSEWGPQCRTLDDFTRAVAPHVPRAATVMGWSLGGMVAIRLAALAAERISRLVLVSTTPRFLTGPDWAFGMSRQVLAGFGARLREDYRATVQEFLALQVRGDERELASLRELRQRLTAGGLPQPGALEAGLDVLGSADLRNILAHLSMPTLVVAGEHDRVTPPDASKYLAGQIRGAVLHLVRRAGHAPFISHGDEFLRVLVEFLLDAPADFPSTGTAT
jgi:pimeloyl-[acyl-carrier protein] methyl ester esterase